MSAAVAGVEAVAPPVLPDSLMSRRERLRLILVLGSLIAVGPLTIDMYLPALPNIKNDLLTTSTAVQLTLTGTLVGLAAGQLLIGPLSDVGLRFSSRLTTQRARSGISVRIQRVSRS